MARRVSKPAKIPISRHRDAMVHGPCLLEDGVVVAAVMDSTIKLDRTTLERRVWEAPADRWELRSVVDDVVLRLGPKGTSVIRASDGGAAWHVDGTPQAAAVPEGIAIAHIDGEIRFHEASTGAVRRTTLPPWQERSSIHVHSRGLLLTPWTTYADRLAFQASDEPVPRWDVPYRPAAAAAVRAAGGAHVDKHVALLRTRDDLIVLRARREDWLTPDMRTPDYLLRVDDRDGTMRWCSEALSAECFELTVAGRLAYAPHSDGLVVVDLETGAVVHRTVTGTLREIYHIGPGVVFQNRVAFPTESGHIVVYDTDGELIHIVKAGLQLWRAIEADGRLIVATGQGFVLVYDESIWGFRA